MKYCSRYEIIKHPARARLFSITAAWRRLLALQAGYAELELDDSHLVGVLVMVHHEYELPLPQHAVGSLLVRRVHLLQTTECQDQKS